MAENDEVKDQDVEETDLPEGEESEMDWQAEARKRDGIAKRYKTQLSKLKAELEETKKVTNALAKDSSPKEKTGFDYAELAYLTAKGIPDEDTDFLFEESKSTGKPLKELLGFNYIQEGLKGRKEARTTKEATPSSTRRSGNAANDTVDYWVAKINSGKATMADVPDFDTKVKVLDARMKIEKQKTVFTDNPIV